jgi:hypothetical protein
MVESRARADDILSFNKTDEEYQIPYKIGATGRDLPARLQPDRLPQGRIGCPQGERR